MLPFHPTWLRAAPPSGLSATLRLPRSTLPPRAPVPSPYLKQVTDDLYHWQRTSRPRLQAPFVLHDGPPYANGPLHLGHALNKITKDIITRHALAQGRRVEYVPGWDCHGLPLEVKAVEKLRKGHKSTVFSDVQIRNSARAMAVDGVNLQMAGFREWAVMADWDNAYKTTDAEYELRQLEVFGHMVDLGLVHRARKPVYWSSSSGTALAESELEYDSSHESTAAIVSFPVDSLSEPVKAKIPGIDPDRLGLLVWTTTPWTLPANRLIGVGAELEYVVVETGDRQLIVGLDRLDHIQTRIGPVTVLPGRLVGSDVATIRYFNPFQGSQATSIPVATAAFVSAEAGTGLVHIAPGHGFDDYQLGLELDAEIAAPVDDEGNFTAGALPDDPAVLQGRSVLTEGSDLVLDYIAARKASVRGKSVHLFDKSRHIHSYPTDWRTRKPVIIRATNQWFINTGALFDRFGAAIDQVSFLPRTGESRLRAFVHGRSQWCISRQRPWGVPIPALYRTDDGSDRPVLTRESITHIASVIRERGIDAWWTDPDEDAGWVPAGLEGTYRRGRDTMDVWFDSGTSWTMLDSPMADVYLEGTDQHRGWFQSSLVTAVAVQTAKSVDQPVRPPYRTLITHGFILDEKGRKMSKSIGNVIAPVDVMNGSMLPKLTKGRHRIDALGPDLLRLWAASSDYTKDVVGSEDAVRTAAAMLKKYRVIFKWLLGVLSDFVPTSSLDQDGLFIKHNGISNNSNLSLADQLALYQLSVASSAVAAAYQSHETFRAVREINNYITNDLSAFFAEAAKDRLYTGDTHDRRAAQEVCYRIFTQLTEALGPIVPLLIAEVEQHTPEQIRRTVDNLSPLQRVWKPYNPIVEGMLDQNTDWNFRSRAFLSLYAAIKTAIETGRQQKLIGSSLECDVAVRFDDVDLPSELQFLTADKMDDEIAAAVVVSRLTISTHDPTVSTIAPIGSASFELPTVSGTSVTGSVEVRLATKHKCVRCWRRLAEVKDELCTRCKDVVHLSSP